MLKKEIKIKKKKIKKKKFCQKKQKEKKNLNLIQNQNQKKIKIKKLKEENNKKYGEKEQKEFKKLKIEYELLIQKLEESEKLNSDLEEKCNLYQNENKSLNDRVIKIEQAFNNLIESKNPKIKDIADLEIHNGISQNLRIELNEILDSRYKLEKTKRKRRRGGRRRNRRKSRRK